SRYMSAGTRVATRPSWTGLSGAVREGSPNASRRTCPGRPHTLTLIRLLPGFWPPCLLMDDLQSRLGRLNPEQLATLERNGNTVVVAGPGSGKTDTIVLKVACLLHREVRPPRGVACLTYGNGAVDEFTMRLRGLGVTTGRRLFLGTVHSFCLNRVLRPFAAITGRPQLARPRVLSPSRQRLTLQAALEAAGVDDDALYFNATLTKIRRAVSCQETMLRHFDDLHLRVARTYEARLAANQ